MSQLDVRIHKNGRVKGEVAPTEQPEPLESNTLIIENEALRRGFTIIPNYILRDPTISFGAKLTYTLLLSYAWQERSCFPGQTRLGEDLGVTRKAVNKYLTELRERGFISWDRRGMGKTNIYRILDFKPKIEADVTVRLHQDVTASSHQEVTRQLHNKDTDYENPSNNVVVDGVLAKILVDKLGVAKKKAAELLSKYPTHHIEEKIELLEWKLATKGRGRPISNPAAWLIQAIETNFRLPPSFTTKDQRKQKAQGLAQAVAEQEKQFEELRAQREQEKQKALAELKRTYGTTQKELDLWRQAIQEIEGATTKPTFLAWFPQTQLLSLKNSTAVIGVPNAHTQDWLAGRMTPVIKRALEGAARHKIEKLSFQVLS